MVLAITPRSEHPLSRKMIDEEALKVLYRLHGHGFSAYLVGGSVRDLLLGKIPKDFDVATSAHPNEIRALFRNSRIIGRRFRLVQVYFKGGKVVQVATFRSHSEFEEKEAENGEIVRTESFGTPEEDALRRDITINGLFYNIADFSILDYVNGMEDLRRGIIRSIGDPDEKFEEDPVRMIRVIRHAARTGFSIEDRTYEAILHHREEIKQCSPSRLRDEFLRDLKEGAAERSLRLMLQTGLLFSLFPDFHRVFGERNPLRHQSSQFLLSLFSLVDQLVHAGHPPSESILLALLLHPLLQVVTPEHPFVGEREQQIYFAQTIYLVTHQLLTPFSFTRAAKEYAYQILTAQSSLERSIRRGVIPKRLRTKRYFRDAVLLFGIEAQARGNEFPLTLRYTISPDLLPWMPKTHEQPGPRGDLLRPRSTKRRRRRFRRRRPSLLHGNSANRP